MKIKKQSQSGNCLVLVFLVIIIFLLASKGCYGSEVKNEEITPMVVEFSAVLWVGPDTGLEYRHQPEIHRGFGPFAPAAGYSYFRYPMGMSAQVVF